MNVLHPPTEAAMLDAYAKSSREHPMTNRYAHSSHR